MITVRSVSKSFGNIKALENISFNIEKGEIFGILGPNGVGKSTIVNILNTLLKPDKGDVIIDGVNIKNDGKNTPTGTKSQCDFYSVHVGNRRKYDPSVYNAINTTKDCSSKYKLPGNSGV